MNSKDFDRLIKKIIDQAKELALLEQENQQLLKENNSLKNYLEVVEKENLEKEVEGVK